MDDEKVLITESTLDDIGEAIREKNGESNKYYPNQMPAAIRRIPTGSGGGSIVAVYPILISGEHIADIVVDGETFALYAPKPIEYTQGTGIEISQNGVVSVSEALRQTIAGKVDSDTFTTAINNLVASVAAKQDLLTEGDGISIHNNVISADVKVSDLSDVNLSSLADGQVLKWNATDEVWENANESGGTTVIANPTGTPTEELSTIQIGDEIYEIVGGGGSGEFKDDILWSGSSVQNVYDLSHNISDYDFIYFKAYYVDGGTHCSSSAMFLASELMASAGDNSVQFDISDEQHYFYFYADDETHINKGSWVNALIIEEIHGIKTGGSGGGGGSQVRELLYEAESSTPPNTITFTKNLTDYDSILFEVIESGNTTWEYSNFFSKEMIEDAIVTGNILTINYTTSNMYIMYVATDAKTLTLNAYRTAYISKIWGVKGGSGGTGGGSSTEVVSIAAGDGTSTRTFTFTKKPKFVHIWYTVPDKWSMSEDIFWEQPWGVYDCTNGNAPYGGGAQGSNTIAFDDVNLTMTITGINALGCANNTNGYGWMLIDYGEGGGGGGSSLPFDVVIDPNDNGINLVPNGGGGGGGSSYAESDKYSTTEKVIGEWVDGKPIYQKTFVSDGTTPLTLPIDLSDLHVDTMIDYKGLCNSYSVSFPNTARGTSAEMHYAGNRILYWDVNSQSMKHSGNTDKYYHLTIQYTKTTD